MKAVPTDAEIDAMSDSELEDYLANSQCSQAKSPEPRAANKPAWLHASGATRTYALLLIVGSIIGIAACWELMDSELTLARHPLAQLTCDINPLVSCGDSLGTWQGNLLGVPNAFIGAMAFSVLTLIGLLLVCGVSLPRWLWWAMVAATAAAIVFIAWFLAVSVLVFGKLCPFCLIIWTITIPISVCTWAQAAWQGHLGFKPATARSLYAGRWYLVVFLYVLVLAVVIGSFWDAWMAML